MQLHAVETSSIAPAVLKVSAAVSVTVTLGADIVEIAVETLTTPASFVRKIYISLISHSWVDYFESSNSSTLMELTGRL